MGLDWMVCGYRLGIGWVVCGYRLDGEWVQARWCVGIG